jgi:ribosome biogenesis protein Nip4
MERDKYVVVVINNLEIITIIIGIEFMAEFSFRVFFALINTLSRRSIL